MEVFNTTRGVVLVQDVEVAFDFWKRFKGLLGRRSFPVGAGLLLKPCNSVHKIRTNETCSTRYQYPVLTHLLPPKLPNFRLCYIDSLDPSESLKTLSPIIHEYCLSDYIFISSFTLF
jgi:hypothetical protein